MCKLGRSCFNEELGPFGACWREEVCLFGCFVCFLGDCMPKWRLLCLACNYWWSKYMGMLLLVYGGCPPSFTQNEAGQEPLRVTRRVLYTCRGLLASFSNFVLHVDFQWKIRSTRMKLYTRRGLSQQPCFAILARLINTLIF